MAEWYYEGKIFELDTDSDYVGFVYLIENKKNNKKYIGKKNFYRTKTLPKTKTRKRRTKSIVESDWKNYYGSSIDLKKDVDLYGKSNFERTILHLCTNKAELSYKEGEEQFKRQVLLRDDYYNAWIMLKVRKSYLL